MNVLVSGGTGFIGRALVGKLIENGNKIVILTRDKRKVDSFLKEKVEVLETDICNSALLENLVLKLQCIDAFIHLAASLDYFGDKKRLFRVNVEGTVNLFNLAKRNRIKKFAYISSIEAIGTIDKESIPADETFVCRPVSTYGESKLEAESYLKKYAERIDLQVCTLRLGNVYGPGSPSFIVPIANAIINKDKLLNFLPVYGERYLHPAYITDIVEGIIKSIQDFDTAKTYILAGEEYITIGRLFELIAQ